jgi:ABC-type branched-subunit amino acid transport system permease subunit
LTERAPTAILGFAFVAACAVGVGAQPYYLAIALPSLFFGLFASAVDLSIGRAGVLSLGSALYFGIGAYGVALAQRVGVGFVAGLLTSMVAAAALAALLGFLGLTARRTSIQFALLTLIVSLTCEQLVVSSDLLGRSNGLAGIDLPSIFGVGLSLRAYYFCCTLAIFAILMALRAFATSPTGRLLLLVRDEPEKAESFGYDVKSIKIGATVVSAAISAACGAANVVVIGIAFPGLFSILPNMLVLVWIALGGPGTLVGPFIAAAAVKLLEFQLGRAYTDAYVLILGVIFVVVVAFAPQGLLTLLTYRKTQK